MRARRIRVRGVGAGGSLQASSSIQRRGSQRGSGRPSPGSVSSQHRAQCLGRTRQGHPGRNLERLAPGSRRTGQRQYPLAVYAGRHAGRTCFIARMGKHRTSPRSEHPANASTSGPPASESRAHSSHAGQPGARDRRSSAAHSVGQSGRAAARDGRRRGRPAAETLSGEAEPLRFRLRELKWGRALAFERACRADRGAHVAGAVRMNAIGASSGSS